MDTDFVDDRGRVVFLFLGRKPIVVLQVEIALILARALALLLARFRNGRNQFGLSPSVARRLVERMPLGIKWVMPCRFLVRRIEDGLLEERAGRRRHVCAHPFFRVAGTRATCLRFSALRSDLAWY